MQKNDHHGLRTWVEIDTKAIRANYRTLRKTIPKSVKMLGVVKSNAYGHCIVDFARELERCGIDWLAVDSLVEALALRKAKIKVPILVLGYTLPEMFAKMVGKNIHLTISSMDGLRDLLKSPQAKKIPIHIKVDTGMHRQGFLIEEQNALSKLLQGKMKEVKVAGLYTHFAIAKNSAQTTFTGIQHGEFVKWRTFFTELGFSPLVHAGATGGTLTFPKAHFDMVRFGIGLYGAWPSDEVRKEFERTLPFKPVLSWKTIVSEVKTISSGSGVGYDLTHRVQRPTAIAVCPVGYWHGYPRALSNKAEVLVRGKRAPVLGRVSMDMIVIDVTDIPSVRMGDEVVLIGKSGKEEVSADLLAHLSGTTAYEILTRLNPLMKRVYR